MSTYFFLAGLNFGACVVMASVDMATSHKISWQAFGMFCLGIVSIWLAFN